MTDDMMKNEATDAEWSNAFHDYTAKTEAFEHALIAQFGPGDAGKMRYLSQAHNEATKAAWYACWSATERMRGMQDRMYPVRPRASSRSARR